ncbi:MULTISPECIES: erythromycin esterase family protein [Bacillaceae]|uniref:Protein-L-isoaspartate O-methyltransferase n=1 Tax=Domibacillus aminovorans TaxID=29332 RepID=A0A177L471_9BACI|nr:MULTISPECIES: erythromycin esterase family protein [Bacillaceae]OAH59561.1 protein-L-isoaspartate O-methyltransferase [Domibacillus aminovorans]
MIKMDQYVEHIQKHAVRFINAADLEPLIKGASHAQYVLLGEASHGTSEFYTTRAEITKKLIEEHGFSFVAVEGDWPACFEVNRYIKGHTPEYTNAEAVLHSFNRWPAWMWANEEVAHLVDWLRAFNENQKTADKLVGFYGLDVYSLWESMEAIIHYLEKTKSPDVEKAKQVFECFEPFHRQAEEYGISAAFYGESCIQEIMSLLQTIHQHKHSYDGDLESSLNMQVNALVASNAEAYYHAMVTNENESWNIRDRHMVEALDHIGQYYGKDAKGIIWEHNTHIGDARATDMANGGTVNVGQLTREKYGKENVYAIGFGTHHGTVIAAQKWGKPAEVMMVPKAEKGSWEDLVHQAGPYNKYLLFTEENHNVFRDILGHRAIGVVYHPLMERFGNYVPSRLSERYNAFIHIEETKALSPLTF